MSRCASSSFSSASHPLSCIPWCPPETPSADRVWEVSVPGNWQAGVGSASAGAASLHSSSTCFLSLDGPWSQHQWSFQISCHPDPATLHWTVPVVPTSLCRRCRRGPNFAPSQAFHQLDLCIPMQPHPALVSWQDAEVAHRRQNPGGAPGCAPLPPPHFANCFSMEKSIVLGGAWDEPMAEFHL